MELLNTISHDNICMIFEILALKFTSWKKFKEIETTEEQNTTIEWINTILNTTLAKTTQTISLLHIIFLVGRSPHLVAHVFSTFSKERKKKKVL